MGFEVFEKRMVRSAAQPFVTIQKKGIFALNHAAFSALGDPKAVRLLYDREKKLIGFRPAEISDEHAYPVRNNSKGTSHLVSGMLFTAHYGIDTGVARRWEAKAGDGILTIDLKKPGTEVTGNRTARQRLDDFGKSRARKV